jgi:ribosome-associated toxin RatA of RatAB toxin-antitoxin module
MRAERSIDVHAMPATIYRLAADVERWPDLLDHYRWVTVLSESETGRVVEMAARRDFIPVRWTALQTLDAATPRIGFTHLSGWTKGMRVVWDFEQRGAQTRVSIIHELDTDKTSAARSWFVRRIIGDFFIQSIAGKTLARMKALAENQHG